MVDAARFLFIGTCAVGVAAVVVLSWLRGRLQALAGPDRGSSAVLAGPGIRLAPERRS